MGDTIQLIVGLGNPGSAYAKTRHNIGFMAVDAVAEIFRAPSFREKFSGEICKADFKSNSVFLLKPMTYMNLSGQSLQQAMRFYKISLSAVLVIHDELDLEFGQMRIKKGGGTAGHNGLKSIVQCCGGNDFFRLRMGIGKSAITSTHDHVLGNFCSAEKHQVNDFIDDASYWVRTILNEGPQKAMNKLHSIKLDRFK